MPCPDYIKTAMKSFGAKEQRRIQHCLILLDWSYLCDSVRLYHDYFHWFPARNKKKNRFPIKFDACFPWKNFDHKIGMIKFWMYDLICQIFLAYFHQKIAGIFSVQNYDILNAHMMLSATFYQCVCSFFRRLYYKMTNSWNKLLPNA